MFDLECRDIADLRHVYTATCRARRTYVTLIDRLGPVAPFEDLRDEACAQIEKLEALFQHCGIAVPGEEREAPIRRFSTIPQAVDAALSAKQRSAAASESLHMLMRETSVQQLED